MHETDTPDDPLAAAAAWHVRLETADQADWDAFTNWLAADDEHRRAYDRVALADLKVEEHRLALRARLAQGDRASSPTIAPRSGWPLPRWAWGGVAASLAVGALSVAYLVPQWGNDATVSIATMERPTKLPLTGGGHIQLAQRTKLSLRDGGAPVIRLTEGEALFDVPHDPSRTMVVHAAGYAIRDIGTRFDVSMQSGYLSIAVAEGSVEVARPDGSAQTLVAGQRFEVAPGKPDRVRPTITSAVGAWTQGRLVFEDAPLAQVVAVVNRYTSRPVSIAPGVSQSTTLSAAIAIGTGKEIADTVARILELDLVPADTGDGLVLRARSSGQRVRKSQR